MLFNPHTSSDGGCGAVRDGTEDGMADSTYGGMYGGLRVRVGFRPARRPEDLLSRPHWLLTHVLLLWCRQRPRFRLPYGSLPPRCSTVSARTPRRSRPSGSTTRHSRRHHCRRCRRSQGYGPGRLRPGRLLPRVLVDGY